MTVVLASSIKQLVATTLFPSTKKRWIFFDSPFGFIFLVALLGFLGISLYMALHIDIDYFDSHNMLLQARRLTDSAYSFVRFDSHRPRTLVAVLTFFNLGYLKLKDHYPNLHAYHFLMAFQTIAFVWIWFLVLSRLFGRTVGYVASLFVLAQQLLVHYSIFILTDISAGLSWGLLFWVFLWTLDQLEYPSSKLRLRVIAANLGFFGTVAALSKHHLGLILPSLFFFQYWLYYFSPNLIPKALTTLKGFKNWAFFSLFINLLTLDLGTRIFGHWGEGFWEHFRKIIREATRQAIEGTPADLYYANTYEILGPVFCALSIGCLFIVITTAKHHLPQNESKRTGAICLILLTLLYTTLTQMIAHREVRYLLPLLPAIFGIVAWGALIVSEPLGKTGKFLWTLVWGLALIHPISRSIKDFNVFFSDPIYSLSKSNASEFWDYLNSPSPAGRVCDKVAACPFALVTKTPFELKNDPYYRRYDMEPQFSFNAAAPTLVIGCPPMEPSTQSRLRKSVGQVQDDTCYVLTEPIFPTVPAVSVIKSLGSFLSEASAKQIVETASLGPQETIHCEQSVADKQFCYVRKEFFGF